jgi:ankyrin repeat protein
MNVNEKLIEAAIKNDLKAIEEALVAGADPNATDDEQSALYWAVYNNQLEVVKLLINAGASVNAKELDGFTSLHQASIIGRRDFIELLLQAGGRKVLNCFDFISRTPLMYAVENRHLDIARTLLEEGSDVNICHEPPLGDTALYYAVENEDVDMVKLLLDAGADPDIPGWMGITPRDIAVRSNTPVAQQIIKLMDIYFPNA